MSILNIYTDGACSNNQGENTIGGYGAVLEYNGVTKELHGGEKDTTNNRMELLAVISAFKMIKKEKQVIHLFSDSSYVINCFLDRWYINWQKNGWKNSKKQPVENKDLWEELIRLVNMHEVSFFRVKGHINVESEKINLNEVYKKFIEVNGKNFSFDDFKHITIMNNRCDELANIGIEENRD